MYASFAVLGVGAFEVGPGVVLGAAGEVGEAGPLAVHVAGGGLFVEGVESEERRVVGPLVEVLHGVGGGFEAGLEISHRARR